MSSARASASPATSTATWSPAAAPPGSRNDPSRKRLMIGMDAATGKALDGNAHLAQSIGDILFTPLGSLIMRRDYGSMLFDLIDQPFNGATRLLIYASTALALRA